MADREEAPAEVSQKPEDAGGVEVKGQVKPTHLMSSDELKDSLAPHVDKDLHPDGEPEHDGDKTSDPGGEATLDDPPVRSPRAGEKLLTSLGTGAGAHNPPDPEKYDEMGRPRE